MSNSSQQSRGSIYDTLYVNSMEKELTGRSERALTLADPYDASQTRSVADKKFEADSQDKSKAGAAVARS